MKRDFNHRVTDDSTETWLTPPELIAALGNFDLDPCCPPDMPWRTATYMNHQGMADGLAMDWPAGRRVWLNPPYGNKTFDWMAKLAHHKIGVALIFARTETLGFHREIWQKAHSVFFFKGRLRFYRADGTKGDTANAPSCLVTYCENDTTAISRAEFLGAIEGKLIRLKG